MEDKFVTYPIALMLKELGYNEPCLAWFGISEILNHVGEIRLYMVGQPNNYEIYTTKTEYFFCNQKDTDVDAPLWQDAIDWLADEYKVYIEVQFADKAFTMYEFCVYRNFEELVQCAAISAKLGDNRPVYRSKFKAREQATLKAIELCQK